MNILITVNAAWNVWHFRRPLIEALLADGHRLTVLAPPDDNVAALEAAGCRFLPLEMSVKGLNPLADLGLMRRFQAIFRRERPDAVLGFTIKNNIFGAMAARRAGVAFLPNVTGLGTAFLSSGMLQFVAEGLYRRAFAGLPVVFFQNEDDRALFLDRGLVTPGQDRVLPGSGINLDHYRPAPDGADASGAAPVFLMIARLLRDKGVLEYVEAARRIRAEWPEARFQLIGAVGADNRTAIGPADVAAWQREGVIDYLGTQDDVRPFLRAARCVVLPSYREGAPRTLIEASAMGRPVIATDVPGCRAVVEDGVTGLFCAPRDGESLAAAMRRFLALPRAEQEGMGRAARAKMEREFDEAIVVAAYRKALAGLPGR